LAKTKGRRVPNAREAELQNKREAFVCFSNEMVLKGAQVLDPSGKSTPERMVLMGFFFAKAALKYKKSK